MHQLLLLLFIVIFAIDSSANETSNIIQKESSTIAISALWKNVPTRLANSLKWQKYGNNTITDSGKFTKITIKDNNKGAYLYLDKILSTFDGKDNKNYKITFSAFVVDGNTKSQIVLMQAGVAGKNVFSLTNSEIKYTVRRTNGSSKRTHIAFQGLPIGSNIYIKQDIKVEKMSDRIYEHPFSEPFKGGTLNMDRQLETANIQQWFFDLNEAGAKYVRIQTNPEKDMGSLSKSAYLIDVINRFKRLYSPKIRQYNMKVLFAFESIPYDNLLLNNRKNIGFWENPETIKNFMDTANYTAQALKDIPEVFALQFMSEPIDQDGKRPSVWDEISLAVINTIRQHTNKFIAWSNGPLGASLYDAVVPFDDDRIIYNFHEFKPYKYTHQGIHGNPLGVRYHASAEMTLDINRIIAFKNRNNNIPIMCGSFSLANWIPDGNLWLKDVTGQLQVNDISSFQFVTGQFKAWDWRYRSVNNGKTVIYTYDITSTNKLWTGLSKYWKQEY